MYNTTTPAAIQIVQQIQEELKKHYQDHKTKRDEYLQTKANLESDAGEEAKAKCNKRCQKSRTP